MIELVVYKELLMKLGLTYLASLDLGNGARSISGRIGAISSTGDRVKMLEPTVEDSIYQLLDERGVYTDEISTKDPVMRHRALKRLARDLVAVIAGMN